MGNSGSICFSHPLYFPLEAVCFYPLCGNAAFLPDPLVCADCQAYCAMTKQLPGLLNSIPVKEVESMDISILF